MSLYDDIQELVDNTPYVGYFSMWCPFDEHATQALLVHEDLDKDEGRGRFHCLSCGKSGTHSYLWKIVTGTNAKVGVSVRKEQKFLPQWAKWERQYGNIEDLVHKAHEMVTTHSSTHAWYLKKRGLMDVYESCMLGYLDDWIFFPILDSQGKIVDVIVRDSKGRSKYIIHSNEEETPLLYVPNWKRVMSSKLVYIVYGLVDALALELCGLPVITGSTGKSLSNKRLIQLNKKWCIIPDEGEDTAARKLAMSLGNFTRIKRLPYLDGEKDPDNIRMNRGLDVLKQLVEENK